MSYVIYEQRCAHAHTFSCSVLHKIEATERTPKAIIHSIFALALRFLVEFKEPGVKFHLYE
jgi:hypothetical protein